MTDRKKPGVAIWATVGLITVLAALSAYASAYALMVRPFLAHIHGESSIPGPHLYLRSPDYSRELRFIGQVSTEENRQQFFAPIHWIDRKLRPDTWYFEMQFL